MSPVDQAGVIAAFNVAVANVMLSTDSPDGMATALGQAVGALAIIAAPETPEGAILARVHAEALKVIEKFGTAPS